MLHSVLDELLVHVVEVPCSGCDEVAVGGEVAEEPRVCRLTDVHLREIADTELGFVATEL